MDRREFLGGVSVAGLSMSLPADILAADLPADITDLSASDLSAAIRQRHVTCVEVMQAYLERIDRFNPVYNAIVSRADSDDLIRQAELADRALENDEYWGWMHGMPIAIKDDTDVEGFPSSHGSPIFAGTMAEKDSLVVSRIRAQGPIFIGKTNLPEFGMGSQSYNPVHGVTGSAWNPHLTAGGSSGGTACGLGTHMLPVGNGGDLMGSLRNPGAYNNVVGFRPTQGRIPDSGGGDLFYQQMGTDGPMGRNAEDTYRLLVNMSGWDFSEPLTLRDVLPSASELSPPDLQGLRIGWMGDFDGYLPMEPGVIEVCESALQNVSGAGAIIEPCQPKYDMDRLWQTWLTLRHWTRHAMRPLYDNPETRALLKPEAIWEIEGAFGTSAEQIFQAGVARAEWYDEIHRLLGEYDVLIVPTAQVFPFDKTIHWPKEVNGVEMDTYHRWMEVVIGGSLAGVPVANIAAGFDAQGRPMGMQVLGPYGEDRRVLEFAMAYEAVTDYLDQRPEMVAAAV